MASEQAIDVDPHKVPRPYPSRRSPLPMTKDALTAEWLTATFENRYPGVAANSVDVVKLIDSHTTKVRIDVGWNAAGEAAGLPRHLCLKTNWSGVFSHDICALEARFYHFAATKLNAPTARCYYADWNDEGDGQGLIALEDLNGRGGRFGHSTDHSGPESVAVALAGLAKLHASLWGDPDLGRQRWLPTSMHTANDYDQVRIMRFYAGENLKNPDFRAIFPKHYLDDPSRVERAYDRLVAYERAFEAPYTLIVGDCHQGNTYVLPNGDRLWLDWQLVRRGRPWRDLTYFMIGSLTIEERRHHQRDLLEHYRKHLAATGVPGVLESEEVWDQYRHWVIYGLQAWAANMDHWGQNGLPMNERFFCAADDLGTWALLGE